MEAGQMIGGGNADKRGIASGLPFEVLDDDTFHREAAFGDILARGG
jgi:hypothetical protein